MLLETLTQRLEHQEALLRQNAALELSHTLREGAPCPVCGSVHHPSPAQGEESLLDPKQVEALRQEERAARQAHVNAAALAGSRETEATQAQEAAAQQRALCRETAAPLGGIDLDTCARQLQEASAQAEAAKRDAARLEARQGQDPGLGKRSGKPASSRPPPCGSGSPP